MSPVSVEAEAMNVEPTEARRDPRKSMFVVGTMYTATGSAPVKIRDMSSSGCLIEGAVIGAPGTKIDLRRGNLSVAGHVAWRKETRAGLSFESSVSVSEWLKTPGAGAPQQRIDELVMETKASTVRRAPEVAAVRLGSARVSTLDLMKLTQAMESLAEDLAEDASVVARHAYRLQTLDLAVQLLRKLAAER